MADPADTISVDAETALGKYKITGASLNNLATFAGLIGIVLLCWMIYGHAGEQKEGLKEMAAEIKQASKDASQVTKESNKEISDAIKDMVRATREQNCILSLPNMPAEQRRLSIDSCRRNSR